MTSSELGIRIIVANVLAFVMGFLFGQFRRKP